MDGRLHFQPSMAASEAAAAGTTPFGRAFPGMQDGSQGTRHTVCPHAVRVPQTGDHTATASSLMARPRVDPGLCRGGCCCPRIARHAPVPTSVSIADC